MTHGMQTNKSSYVEKRRHGVRSVPRGLRPSFPRHSSLLYRLPQLRDARGVQIRRQHNSILDSLTLPQNNPFSLSTSSFGAVLWVKDRVADSDTQIVAVFTVLFFSC